MTRSRDTADQINRINSSAANATAITVDSSENVTLAGAITGTTASFTRLDINASNTKLKGDLLGNTDGAYDIGASGANRPRNLYLSNSISAADITTTGAGFFGGNVGIGTSAPSFENGAGMEIRYAGGNGAHLKLTDNASGAGGTNGFDLYAFNTSGYIENYEAGATVFRNNGDESMRISAAGELITKGGVSIDDGSLAGPELSRERGQNLKLKGTSGTDAGITAYNNAGNHAFQIYGNPSETGGSGDGAYGFLDGNWSGWDIKKYKNGNLFLNNSSTHGLAGDGILLGGTTAANKLYDYETGTFNLTLVGYYGNPSTTVLVPAAYTKIGNIVNFRAANQSINNTGAAGNMWLTGLPFITIGHPTVVEVTLNGIGTYPNSSPFGSVSGYICYIYKHVDQAAPTAVFHNVVTNGGITITGSYQAT